MKTMRFVIALAPVLLLPGAVSGQDPIEVPLRVDSGRMIVEVEGSDGRTYDFILGISNGLLTESGAAALSGVDLSLGGVPIAVDDHQTVPDGFFGHQGDADPIGVLGGGPLVDHDILIDVVGGKLLLKPSGRSVRWPGYSLSNPVSVTIMHDYLVRMQVQIGETVSDALLDLGRPVLDVSPPLAAKEGVSDGPIDSFRMGYSGWSGVPISTEVTSTVRAWGGEERDFVQIGAPVALGCVIAVSWRHQEVRTCLQ